ncbi:MAG TPA: hypothetical protein VGB48_09750 [Allosphingosinicella sp.]|jgi:hypothetical protein
MGKTILGVVAGIIAAFATIWAIEMVHHLLYPVPNGVRLTDNAGLARYIAGMSLPQMLFIAGGWLAGAFVGGVVAAKIAGRTKAVWIVAGLVALAGIGNILYVAHPLFLQISAIVAPVIGGWLATKTVRERAPSAHSAEDR